MGNSVQLETDIESNCIKKKCIHYAQTNQTGIRIAVTGIALLYIRTIGQNQTKEGPTDKQFHGWCTK